MDHSTTLQYAVSFGSVDGTCYGNIQFSPTVDGALPYTDEFILSLATALAALDWPAPGLAPVSVTKTQNSSDFYHGNLAATPPVFE